MKPTHVAKIPRAARFALIVAWSSAVAAAETSPVTFSTAFESAAIGRIEKLGDTSFRVHVLGQQDERGRNRPISSVNTTTCPAPAP
jgi:hypothetical protein